jgi:hypothetical protein
MTIHKASCQRRWEENKLGGCLVSEAVEKKVNQVKCPSKSWMHRVMNDEEKHDGI